MPSPRIIGHGPTTDAGYAKSRGARQSQAYINKAKMHSKPVQVADAAAKHAKINQLHSLGSSPIPPKAPFLPHKGKIAGAVGGAVVAGSAVVGGVHSVRNRASRRHG